MKRRFYFWMLLLLVGCVVRETLRAQAEVEDARGVRRVEPALFGFYAKVLDCSGVRIRSAAAVEDRALDLACGKVNEMLMNQPVARANLIQRGAELHLIGRDEPTSALPELHGERSKSYVDASGQRTDLDERTRGVGGLYASCGEENLLKLPSDRYRGGSDICVHEFAHDVMNYGLDAKLRSKIEKQYKQAMREGLWKGHYAAVNAEEYFAELSMWYFGAHGEFVSANFPAAGGESLRGYDAKGYAVLDAIYSGHERPERVHVVAAQRVPDVVGTSNGMSPAELLIANNTAQAMQLFWLDGEGKARSYGRIEAYSRATHVTTLKNVWIIQDGLGKIVGRYEVTAANCEVVLN